MERVLAVGEFERRVDGAAKSGRVVLVQVGSDACVRCPAFGAAVAELKQTYEFDWFYCDAHDEECELVEYFQIRQLPAFVIVAVGKPEVVANATPADVAEAVKRICLPTFVTNLDF